MLPKTPPIRLSLASALALSLVLVAAPATYAAENSDLPEGWYIITDEGRTAIPESVQFPESSSESPEGDGEVTPSLIGFDQWFACYTLGQSDTVFVSYDWAWNGTVSTKELKCGTSGWGYRHIENGHQTDWQNKLDVVQAAGYGTGYSWDDVMAVGVYAGLAYPDYVREQPANNKICVVGALGYYTDAGALIDSFNVVTSFATDSTRVITSFPTSSSTC